MTKQENKGDDFKRQFKQLFKHLCEHFFQKNLMHFLTHNTQTSYSLKAKNQLDLWLRISYCVSVTFSFIINIQWITYQTRERLYYFVKNVLRYICIKKYRHDLCPDRCLTGAKLRWLPSHHAEQQISLPHQV